MTKQEETVLAFLLVQELPLLDDDMKWDAVSFMYKGYISKAKLAAMLGINLADLPSELEKYDYHGGYN